MYLSQQSLTNIVKAVEHQELNDHVLVAFVAILQLKTGVYKALDEKVTCVQCFPSHIYIYCPTMAALPVNVIKSDIQ